MNGICDSYCRGCIYRGGNSEEIKSCNYYLMTSIRRPCPAGKGCTVRVRRKRTQEEQFRDLEMAYPFIVRKGSKNR